MADHFKKFIGENRQEFESHKEDYQALWQDIEAKLPARKKGLSIHRNFFWKAAVVLLLAVSGFLALKVNRQQTTMPVELSEAATHYAPLIAERMEVLQVHSPEVGSQVLADLEVLDQAFNELKEDLADDANNEEVVEAMIENYRIKLGILEQILDEIQNKEDEQNNHKGTNL
ncbi:MAG: hypothetical protein ACR2MX_15680 [Cyclobacteriaceae bacterium]